MIPVTISNGTGLAVWTLQGATGRPVASPDTLEADEIDPDEVHNESD